MGELLQIRDLSSGYNGHSVLRNVSFSLQEGEVLAVIGQNGCGKSTLLKSIARIIPDNAGRIIFGSVEISRLRPWDLKRHGISYFTQGGLVFPTMKVSEHFDLAMRDKSRTEAATIKEECLSYFPELGSCMDKRGGNLSRGQRQMLSFGMLVTQQTRCWLLDEPTAGLSPDAVKGAVEFLKRMKMRARKSIVLVEHNYPVAFDLADRVAIIKEGTLYDNFTKAEFQKEDFLNIHLYN